MSKSISASQGMAMLTGAAAPKIEPRSARPGGPGAGGPAAVARQEKLEQTAAKAMESQVSPMMQQLMDQLQSGELDNL